MCSCHDSPERGGYFGLNRGQKSENPARARFWLYKYHCRASWLYPPMVEARPSTWRHGSYPFSKGTPTIAIHVLSIRVPCVTRKNRFLNGYSLHFPSGRSARSTRLALPRLLPYCPPSMGLVFIGVMEVDTPPLGTPPGVARKAGIILIGQA